MPGELARTRVIVVHMPTVKPSLPRDPGAAFHCGACGAIPSTVTLVRPGRPDPRLTPEPPGVPPGISTLMGELGIAGVSIDGGPVSVTIGVAGTATERVAAALGAGDAAALYAIDDEFAPFWCPRCEACYCRTHYVAVTLFDDGFFDEIRGTCPAGHERRLED